MQDSQDPKRSGVMQRGRWAIVQLHEFMLSEDIHVYFS